MLKVAVSAKSLFFGRLVYLWQIEYKINRAMTIKFFAPLVIVWLALGACVTYIPKQAKSNFSAMYNPTHTELHPEFQVLVKSDTTANILVRIPNNELLFTRANRENKMKAQIAITALVYSDIEKRIVVDSVNTFQEVLASKTPFTISVRTTSGRCSIPMPLTCRSGRCGARFSTADGW